MKNKIGKSILFILGILFFLPLIHPTDAFGVDTRNVTHKIAAVARIVKINNLNMKVTQGKSFAFPTKVLALMSDGTMVSQKITWSAGAVSTAKVKTYSLSGKVKGYADPVKLTLRILPKAPTGLTAKKSYTGWIKISWSTVVGASGYNLYYSNDEETWEKWNNTVTKNSAMLSGVENGVELYFRVASVSNGIESLKSPSVYFTMLSSHLPQYPNFPTHPDFNIDKTNGSFQGNDGVYYYKYTTSRVGKTFVDSYFERILQPEDFIYDPGKTTKTLESGANSKYGEYTQETTDAFFTSADETYVIRRVVVDGMLDETPVKEDYYLVFKRT